LWPAARGESGIAAVATFTCDKTGPPSLLAVGSSGSVHTSTLWPVNAGEMASVTAGPANASGGLPNLHGHRQRWAEPAAPGQQLLPAMVRLRCESQNVACARV
jgi:hypothetical protein